MHRFLCKLGVRQPRFITLSRAALDQSLHAVHREFADHLTVREADVLAGALRKVLAARCDGHSPGVLRP